jgi:hypothetical protein
MVLFISGNRLIYCRMRWRLENRCISLAVLLVGQVVFTVYYVVVMAPLKPPPSRSFSPAVYFLAPNASTKDPLLSGNMKVPVHLSKLQLDRRKFFLGQNTSDDCFLPGTDVEFSKRMSKCQCQPGWHGQDCGLPEVILR